MSKYDAYDVLFPCEILMENGTWEPGEVLATQDTEHGMAAFIRWQGIHAWFFRCQVDEPDEWRRI